MHSKMQWRAKKEVNQPEDRLMTVHTCAGYLLWTGIVQLGLELELTNTQNTCVPHTIWR